MSVVKKTGRNASKVRKPKAAKPAQPKGSMTDEEYLKSLPKDAFKRPKRPSIRSAIFEMFDKVGVDKVGLAEALKKAQSVKSDTKFSKWHLYYYRKVWKDKQYAESVKARLLKERSKK